MLADKRKAFFFCLFIVCLLLPVKLIAQVQHDSGFFWRCLIGLGNGKINDAVNNPATGTAFRSSLALGAFVSRDFALHLGYGYTSSSDIRYEGKADQPLHEGEYSHHSLNGGLNYFLTNLNIYFSLEGRLSIGGSYELKGTILETQADGSQIVVATRGVKGKFSEEEEKFGVGFSIGTEEWLLNNSTVMGMAILYSFDPARKQVFYGLALGLSYY